MGNFRAGLALLTLLALGSACEPVSEGFEPSWITASWSGGAAGEPNDRSDRKAEEWDGQMCPPDSVLLTNHDGFAGLTVVNNCAVNVTYGICLDKGSLPQPEHGLPECAEDPLETSFSDLQVVTLTPGEPGKSFNATEELFVNMFYCADENHLSGSPLECLAI